IIRTDVERLQKILVILIENAVKYSPPDSSVVVATRLTGSGTDVTVSDQGVGIDKTDIVNIFDRFYRADNSRSETIGYGLGLSIVKKILSEINATISVKSTIHRGSQFTVSLPNSMEKDS
ncbi:MAG: ATP-binding protein, partial [Candidatus Saccharibacteria bacterium]